MTDLHEVRCPNCNKKLFMASANTGVVETKCNRCGAVVRFPAQKPEIIGDQPPNFLHKRKVLKESSS